jgi:hypothetical protein
MLKGVKEKKKKKKDEPPPPPPDDEEKTAFQRVCGFMFKSSDGAAK